MALPDYTIRIELLKARIKRTNAVYARFYGPLCLLIITLTFFPYYESESNSSISYGNIWQEVLLLRFGVILMALVVLLTSTLLAFAAVGKPTASGLIAILVGASLTGCTLLHSPTHAAPPPLTGHGVFDIVLSFITAGLVLTHAMHLFVLDLAFQRRGD